VRRYLFGYHGERIAEFVEVESDESSDRSSLPPMALAKRRARPPCWLNRLSRSVAFIATLMDSKGFESMR